MSGECPICGEIYIRKERGCDLTPPDSDHCFQSVTLESGDTENVVYIHD